ncbi:MAG: hypothetical protein FJZ16_03025 [Candidatus Omnitrophica bacterium]|nr:hypothetical protein [Candidatus Omnitrophota bacterium]
MNAYKTKSLENIEQRIKDTDENSFRYQVLKCAKDFKTSWVELGRALYSVWKDKLYKEWGYNTFEAYIAKEIGIRRQTAMKLLRSYWFLEKEEPEYLKDEYVKNVEASKLPNYESVYVLRQAKAKSELDENDYTNLKKDVFEKGRDARDIKKDLTALVRQRKESDPQEAWKKKRVATVKRFITTLKSLKYEIETSKLLPTSLIKETGELIKKLEVQIER